MTHNDRFGTDQSDAARILRQYKDRIERLEQTQRGQSGQIQITREVNETVTVSDSVTVTEKAASNFTYGQSKYGYDEYGDSS